MNVKKMLATGGVTAACAAGVMVATTGTASADWNQCGAGQVCAWDNAGGTGAMIAGGTDMADLAGMNNRASSLKNNSGVDVCFYRGDGRYIVLSANSPGYDIYPWIDNQITNWHPC